jgi:hypothetical protein
MHDALLYELAPLSRTRWHMPAHAAAHALPASVKTELDGCVASGVFAADDINDDAIAALVRTLLPHCSPRAVLLSPCHAVLAMPLSLQLMPLCECCASQARAGAELSLLVLGQLHDAEADPSASIVAHARQLTQLVSPTGGYAPAVATAHQQPQQQPQSPQQQLVPLLSEAHEEWGACAWLPPSPPFAAASWLPPPVVSAPSPSLPLPALPHPRVCQLTEELAQLKAAQAEEIAALAARLRGAHEELAHMRALYAEQQQPQLNGW